MATVTVYQFKQWSQAEGEYLLSKSKTTREIIDGFGGEIIPETEQEVDEAELDGNRFFHP